MNKHRNRLWIIPFAIVICIIQTCKKQDCERCYYLSTSFREPATEGLRFVASTDGLVWDTVAGIFLTPGVGGQGILRDPSIIQTPDDTFRLVWTTAWKGDLGFGYAASADLIDWTEQRFIPVMEADTATVNVWAPDLFYDADSDRVVITWASCLPGRFCEGVEAPDNNHRLYCTTTRDFVTFTPTRLMFDPGYSVIDGTICRHDDRYVLVFKDNTRPCRNIKAAFGKTALGPWTDVTESFTQSFCEGPTVLDLDGTSMIYYDSYRNHKYGVVSTTDFKMFRDMTRYLQMPEGHKHGTTIAVTEAVYRRLMQQNAPHRAAETLKEKIIGSK